MCLAEPALFGPGPNRLAWEREELFDQPLISVWQAQWGLNEVWPGEPHTPKTPLIKDRAFAGWQPLSKAFLPWATAAQGHRQLWGLTLYTYTGRAGLLTPNCQAEGAGLSTLLTEINYTHAGTSPDYPWPRLCHTPNHKHLPTSWEPSLGCIQQHLTHHELRHSGHHGRTCPASEAEPLMGVSCPPSQRHQQSQQCPSVQPVGRGFLGHNYEKRHVGPCSQWWNSPHRLV